MIKRVMFYDSGKPSPNGGSGGSLYSLFELVKLIDKSKFEVLVVFKYYHNIINDFKEIGIKTEVIFNSNLNTQTNTKVSDRIKILKYNPKLIKYLKKELYYIKNIFSKESSYLKKNIKKFNPDIIHANNRITSNSNLIILAFLSKKRCFVHQRQYDYNLPVVLKLLKNYPKYISISSSISENLIQNGVLAHKIELIPNWLNTQKINQNYISNTNTLDFETTSALWLGRIIEWKGLIYVLEIINELKSKHNISFHLDVYGDYNENKEYYNLITQKINLFKLNKLVCFKGYTHNSNISFENYSVCFHSSIKKEPFGRTIIEAISRNILVFSTGLGGSSDIISNGVNGIIFDINNSRQTTNKLIELSNDYTAYNELKKNASKKLLDNFTNLIVKSKLNTLYD
jgi:glycosyltransferase involved in cell wall biosynthesis